MSPDQALAAARRASGVADGARLVSLALPTAGGRPTWRVQLADPGRGPVNVKVDDASGKAALQTGGPADGPSGGDPIARVMRLLHEGEDYGLAWRVAVTFAGVAPMILGLSGVVMWFSRRRKSAPRRELRTIRIAKPRHIF
jgi:uncharacterized iron-regulated membrane protein